MMAESSRYYNTREKKMVMGGKYCIRVVSLHNGKSYGIEDYFYTAYKKHHKKIRGWINLDSSPRVLSTLSGPDRAHRHPKKMSV